jgi:hypothetical protein
MTHLCHAYGCPNPVPPSMFMCQRHWYLLRKPLRNAVWREYTPGQEKTKTPTLRYLCVQQFAIAAIALFEGKWDVAEIRMHLSLMLRSQIMGKDESDPLGWLPSKLLDKLVAAPRADDA